MKYCSFLFFLLLVFSQAACTQARTAAVLKGVNAGDEELLATLASLAKRGSDAVCNPAVIENELDIKLGEFKIDKTPSLAGQPREAQWTDAVTSPPFGRPFKSARYYRGRSNGVSSCQIGISFFETRLCDTDSKKTQKIMGTNVEYGPWAYNVPIRSHFYSYQTTSGLTSSIKVGSSDRNCASEFTLTTNGEWK